MLTSPYLKEHQNGKMGKIGLRDVRPVFQNLLIGFSKTVHKLFKFQEMFFFRQNYRLTTIHSQTLQLSCNSFKLPQESCYLYLFYLYRLSRHLNFPHTIQALISYHPKNLTHPSNFCTLCPKCTFLRFSPYIPYQKSRGFYKPRKHKSALKLFIPHYK